MKRILSRRLLIKSSGLVGLWLWIVLLPDSFQAADVTCNSFDGTYRGRVVSELVRHQQEALPGRPTASLFAVRPLALRDDIANIAILEDSSGVVLRPNEFDLNELSINLRPYDDGYTAEPTSLHFEEQAQARGVSLALNDDDATSVVLPFQFPFFGELHETIWVHSDGNLSFVDSDADSSVRSLSRAVSGPPRIVPLFADLDPSQSGAQVTILHTSNRVVFTWKDVPEYSFFGNGRRQTFQTVLYINGRIDFHYASVNLSSTVVGIAPGNFRNDVSSVDFSEGAENPLTGAMAEIFTQKQEIDPVAVTQNFYRNHDDAYDFIVLFNDMDFEAGFGAFAYELNIRNEVEGIGSPQPNGNPVFDLGKEFGSPRRLQSFLNMGPLSNYPDDPAEVMSSLGHNSTLSILGHEAGHRFLVFTSFLDPISESASTKLLGRDDAHWSFFFNSDASVLEGNRITDHGNTSPRFETTAAVEKFGHFDQYLMGLREAEDVTPSFYVEDPSDSRSPGSPPEIGVTLDGTRREVDVGMIISAAGSRRPQQNVAQREFNFAFVLLVREGTTPSEDTLGKLDRIRTAWKAFFHEATDQRSNAHTELVKKLHLSTWPASGVPLGGSAVATVKIANPLTNDLDVALSSEDGFIGIPPIVTIGAGESEAVFNMTGLELGVTNLNAHVLHSSYDVARTVIRVRDSLEALTLRIESGDSQASGEGGVLPLPVVFRLRDEDKLHYSGVTVTLVPNGDGVVTPPQMVTDASGRIEVEWRVASDTVFNVLRATLEEEPGVQATATAVVDGVRPEFSAIGVVNAASFNVDGATQRRVFTPGGLYSIFGANLTVASEPGWAPTIPLPRELAGAAVSINGVSVPLLFVSDRQINVMVPFNLATDEVETSIMSAAGRSETVVLPVQETQPGIFFDAQTNFGAILNSSGLSAISAPPRPGEVVQIFTAGLGLVNPPVVAGTGAPLAPLSTTTVTPIVKINGQPIEVLFSGLAPLFVGLYQVNAQLPQNLSSDIYSLQMESQGVSSNEVLLKVR